MTNPKSEADLTPDDHPEPDGTLPPDSKLTVDPVHEAIEEPGGFDPEWPAGAPDGDPDAEVPEDPGTGGPGEADVTP